MSDAPVRLRTHQLVKAFGSRIRRRTLFQIVRAGAARRASAGHGPDRSLDGIDLEARQNEIVGIVGTNGAGKTTLLKTLAGLYAPTSGRVEIDGEVALFAGLGAGMVEELSVG